MRLSVLARDAWCGSRWEAATWLTAPPPRAMSLRVAAGSDPELSRTVERYRQRRKAGAGYAQYTRWSFQRWTNWANQSTNARARGAELCKAWQRRRRLAAAFRRCAQQVGRRESLRMALGKLLCRRVRGVLHLTVRQWRCGILATKCERATELQDWQIWAHLEAYRRRRVSSGVRYILYRMRARYLAAGLCMWRSRVVRRRRSCLLLAVATRGRTRRALHQFFANWMASNFADARASQHSAVDEAVAAQLRQGMQDDAGWWLRVWRRGIDMRHRAKRVLMTRLARIQRRELSGVFGGWAWHTVGSRKREVACRRVLLRLQHGCIAGAMAGWRERAHQSHRQRSMVRRATSRMFQRIVTLAYAAWAGFLCRRRQLRCTMAGVIGRIQGRVVSKALTAWVATVTDAVRRRVACKRALGRLISQASSRALSGWQERTSEHRRQRQLCARALCRLQNKVLASVHTRWAAFARESGALQMEAQRAAATVDVAVLESLVAEYDQQKQLWGKRLQELGQELAETQQLVALQHAQAEQMATEKAKLESELQRTNDATTLCEGLMAQLMDGNQRLRREKKSLEELAIDGRVDKGDFDTDSVSSRDPNDRSVSPTNHVYVS